MRHGTHGSFGARATLALGAVLAVFTAACGGGGSSSGGVGGGNAFSAQLLPVELASGGAGYGNVAFAADGDLLVVGGGSDSLWRISRTDGSVTEFPGLAGGDALLSVVDPGTGVFYVGSDAGDVYEVDGAGISTLNESTGAGAIHGMVMAASGYGDLLGSIVAATESGGIIAVDPAGGTSTIAAPPGVVYSDLEFRQNTLYAVDYTNGEIDEVPAGGGVTTFASTDLVAPDGLAVDVGAGRLLVADSGLDVLKSVSLTSAIVTDLGAQLFDAGPEPSGLAFDGAGNLAMLTEGSLVVRGVGLPGYDTADFPVNVVGANTSKGGMTLDTDGDVVVATNGASANRVFRIPRDGSDPVTLAADLGSPGSELLTAVAHDAATGTTYVGTDGGDIHSVNAGGTALFASLPGAAPVTGLAIAPESFDATLGGRLIASTPLSGIYEIDIAAPTPAQFAGAVLGGTLSDLVFGADGTLYVLDNNQGAILTATAGGTYDTEATGLGAPNGIAIDEGGQRFFVVNPSQVLEVPMGGGGSSQLASLLFHADANPNGVLFDGLGTLLVKHGDGDATVSALTVFP